MREERRTEVFKTTSNLVLREIRWMQVPGGETICKVYEVLEMWIWELRRYAEALNMLLRYTKVNSTQIKQYEK